MVDSLDEMVEAVNKVDEIDPVACRDHVEKQFNVSRMVDDYLTVYQSIAEGGAGESRETAMEGP